MNSHWFRNYLLLVLLMFAGGCRRGPTAGDHVDRAMQALEVYLFKSAEEAEVAMLDLEEFTLACKEQKVEGINYDQHLAAIYSRLYRVQTVLGKLEIAATNFNLASNYWDKHYRERGALIPSGQEMKLQIEENSSYWGKPIWQK